MNKISLILLCCLCIYGNSFAQTNKLKMPVTMTKKTMICKLTTPELQKRKTTVIATIKKLIKEKKELTNGYAYRFEGSDHQIDLLTDFIKTERQCCDFFNFSIDVRNDQTAWLKITGAKGVKGFIASELEL
ncbi:hypothetical protein DIU31_031440 [Mucilaginibacter rubeus]|uniref:Uncharacterized protein n=1 Tax=Mucilaginibacter rubeus TaxID=2027860 RepID=A0AAE6JLN4_9SPHI|nr:MULTISPECIES: hypothetical protein [Mucilaginibacter]QEM07795.1 hypothetical protein DIU31_031440 [Mucilaginibacter rubeus]QEM20247.1 hypothetical protein DIU38_031045 [Mucilaginibacter gossypii]QTE43035.1 hypothetical protein J3L19_29620 [Mucilaginibacter rubeus]QTE49636.1 hypothetical protein J3L21_29580 [Mucilaginibacter rubeus]QTE54731.1 hypothetical protein J3L23_21200 [Mucilaginibacter rubeus]